MNIRESRVQQIQYTSPIQLVGVDPKFGRYLGGAQTIEYHQLNCLIFELYTASSSHASILHLARIFRKKSIVDMLNC